MAMLLKNVRYGARMLLKHPGFTLVAVLTLALGIGANSAIFSVIHAVLLRPLPYQEPERLMMIWESEQGLSGRFTVSFPDFAEWRKQNQVFSAIAAYKNSGVSLTDHAQPELLRTTITSASLFPLLGVNPLLGRTFLPDEDEEGNPKHVVVLSYPLWHDHFSANPQIIGKSIALNQEQYTVVGVMPKGFHEPKGHPALWLPLALDNKEAKKAGNHNYTVIG